MKGAFAKDWFSHIMLTAWMAFALVLPSPINAQAADILVKAADILVKDVRVGVHSDKTRLVVEASRMLDFRAFTLAGPYRVVIDVPTLSWANMDTATNWRANAKGLIHQFRVGQYKPGYTRIVLESKSPVQIIDAFPLTGDDKNSPRLVVDIQAIDPQGFNDATYKIFGSLDPDSETSETSQTTDSRAEVSLQVKPVPKPPVPPPPKPGQAIGQSTAGPANANALAVAPPSSLPKKRDKYVIVIDPGHGGKDPGAIGVNDLYEKKVTLSTSTTLKEMLEKTGRYKVFLTRDTDIYLKLRQRASIGRKHGADLFLSIHADSNDNHDVHGTSVYTLSDKASDREAAKLAEKENRADVISEVSIENENDMIFSILVDLVQRDTMNEGKKFAAQLVSTLNPKMLLPRRPHRSAGFAVLTAHDVPSALIELGNLGHPKEADLLGQKAHQEKLARSIVRAIDAYFDKREAR